MALTNCRWLYCNYTKHLCTRNISTDQVILPQLSPRVRSDIESDRIKPRKHPGVIKIGTGSLPANITDAIQVIMEDHPVSKVLIDAKMLSNYLFSRHYPWEEEDLRERKSGFINDARSRIGDLPDDSSEEETRHYHNIVSTAVRQLMMKYNYKWAPLDLHRYSCLVYMLARAAPNYAVCLKVFSEITRLYPDYRPTSLFDFGSGIGSVSWAAKTCWRDYIKEYINIDSSSSMNDLASLILRGGIPNVDLANNIYFRNFLPAQHTKHSLVVSSHSLMELSSRQSRLDTILNLWQKTKDFLVIIEQGTKPCFKIIVEARDFILSLEDQESPAYVFAPCPHDGACPRLLRGPYPCHYSVSYMDLPVGKRQFSKKELYSYVILRKGKREKREEMEWPRVVRPVLLRHNHVICRLCSSHGDLREVIFTKNRHGKTLYKCAKVTKWGDRLPVRLPAVNSSESTKDCVQENETTDDEKI